MHLYASTVYIAYRHIGYDYDCEGEMVKGDASRYQVIQVPVLHIETWKSLWMHQVSIPVVLRIPGAGLRQELRILHHRLRGGWCLQPFFGPLLNEG